MRMGIPDNLAKLRSLYLSGQLTDFEYDEARSKLLRGEPVAQISAGNTDGATDIQGPVADD